MMKSPVKFGARNQKRSCLCIALGAFLTALGVSILLSLVFWSRLSASISHFARDGCDPTAIVILGGGVAADGGVPEHTSERVKLALQVDQELKQCAVFVTLSGGTPHKPNPVDSKGFPIWEATAAAKALLDAGISADRILEESFSLDTIGNVRAVGRYLIVSITASKYRLFDCGHLGLLFAHGAHGAIPAAEDDRHYEQLAHATHPRNIRLRV